MQMKIDFDFTLKDGSTYYIKASGSVFRDAYGLGLDHLGVEVWSDGGLVNTGELSKEDQTLITEECVERIFSEYEKRGGLS
jgi:hypothetical protein